MLKRFVGIVVVVVGLFYIGVGLWAFFAPRAFFEGLAVFPPYNEHFIHDIGAFQMGLGVALLAAFRWQDGLVVALAGNVVAAIAHWIAHVIDRDLGGRATDPIGLGLVMVAVILALLVATRDKNEVPAQTEVT